MLIFMCIAYLIKEIIIYYKELVPDMNHLLASSVMLHCCCINNMLSKDFALIEIYCCSAKSIISVEKLSVDSV